MAPTRSRDIATPSNSHYQPYTLTTGIRRRPSNSEDALQKDDALKVSDIYTGCSVGAREQNRIYSSLNNQFCPACMEKNNPAHLIPAPPTASYFVVHRLPMGEVDTSKQFVSAHSSNAMYASPTSGMPACQDGMPGAHQNICQAPGCGICAIIAQGPYTYTPPAWMQGQWNGELHCDDPACWICKLIRKSLKSDPTILLRPAAQVRLARLRLAKYS
ncbi:hypothetical protein CPC08DRAFT_713384 [Agrocybe pediades]|nr:hypothetical protein CPC08DRAFT_713384 [Agrocybe pediades]